MKVCNRCRTEIKRDPNANLVFPTVLLKASLKRAFFCSWEDIDLCDRCKRDFLEWIKCSEPDAPEVEG